ncbi:MAG: TetR/AcrR family transcriptional regulator C-terminal domain-containing protein [Rhodoglobus sp.]
MKTAQAREPLTSERVLEAACTVADADGISAVTMRRVAQHLGVEAMSLYHHTANKEALLDGLVDLVFTEVLDAIGSAIPSNGSWQTTLRSRILVARSVMLSHPWAPALIETRTTISLSQIRYVDAAVGVMHDGGLSYNLAHHALHALGSRSYGFVQELGDNGRSPTDLEPMASVIPSLVAMLREVSHDDLDDTLGWCDDQTEFEFGLDILLDGLERLRKEGSQ